MLEAASLRCPVGVFKMKLIFYTFLMCVVKGLYADYIGAVVEYNPVKAHNEMQTIEENLKSYVYYIEQAREIGVNLIVFPEYGLTGLTENPENYSIPIPNVGTYQFESYPLLRLSDAAQANHMYVIVNILEKSNGTNNSTLYYNTNLVFADNGTLIARYRKINLFREPKLTPGKETLTFATTFGTFGLITCQDILYYNPSQTILENTGVTDVIYPAAWNSYLPFYMSLEVQAGYAIANRVNILASNINDPSNGRGGSSIVISDGTVLRRILTDIPATNIAYAHIKPPSSATKNVALTGFNVFPDDTSKELEHYKNLTDFNYNSYVFKSLDLSKENITEEICDGNFCCTFNIITLKNETDSSEVYKLVAYNGKTKFDTTDVHVKFCGLVGCIDQTPSSCGVRPPTSYSRMFRQLKVWGNWQLHKEEFYRPISLRGNLQPIYNTTYLENRTNTTLGISFSTTRPDSNVVLFGWYGRNGTGPLAVSLGLLLVLVLLQKLF